MSKESIPMVRRAHFTEKKNKTRNQKEKIKMKGRGKIVLLVQALY